MVECGGVVGGGGLGMRWMWCAVGECSWGAVWGWGGAVCGVLGRQHLCTGRHCFICSSWRLFCIADTAALEVAMLMHTLDGAFRSVSH